MLKYLWLVACQELRCYKGGAGQHLVRTQRNCLRPCDTGAMLICYPHPPCIYLLIISFPSSYSIGVSSTFHLLAQQMYVTGCSFFLLVGLLLELPLASLCWSPAFKRREWRHRRGALPRRVNAYYVFTRDYAADPTATQLTQAEAQSIPTSHRRALAWNTLQDCHCAAFLTSGAAECCLPACWLGTPVTPAFDDQCQC